MQAPLQLAALNEALYAVNPFVRGPASTLAPFDELLLSTADALHDAPSGSYDYYDRAFARFERLAEGDPFGDAYRDGSSSTYAETGLLIFDEYMPGSYYYDEDNDVAVSLARVGPVRARSHAVLLVSNLLQ